MFKLTLQVRDYECDMQGIVNNATYLNYFEHARHAWMAEKGIDFSTLTLTENVMVVVYSINVRYAHSLRGMDEFVISTHCEKNHAIKLDFQQRIHLVKDNTFCAQATISVVEINENGKPRFPEALYEKLQNE